ncbi:cytochrome P450 2K4-like [Rhinophrynus dorsalis]
MPREPSFTNAELGILVHYMDKYLPDRLRDRVDSAFRRRVLERIACKMQRSTGITRTRRQILRRWSDLKRRESRLLQIFRAAVLNVSSTPRSGTTPEIIYNIISWSSTAHPSSFPAAYHTKKPRKAHCSRVALTTWFHKTILVMDLTTILLSVIIGIFLINVLYGRKSRIYQNFPPGPKPLPIMGNLHLLNLQKPYKTLMELSKKYGSVFTIHLGTEKVVVLCGYETVKDALVNYAEEFSERPIIPIFNEISKGNGLIFSHGENWKVMRRFTISTLRDFGMGKKSIESKIIEECDFLVQNLKSYKGKPFENSMIMNAAVANIIVSLLLGHRFKYEDPTLTKLIRLVNENIRLLASRMVMLHNVYPTVTRWLPGSHKTVSGNTIKMYQFIKETFTKRKDQLDVNDQRDLIDAFIVKQQEEKPNPGLYFHIDNLTALVSNLFGAGMETTSTTLRWGFLLMMKYPEIQKNVQNEIEKVIGSAQPQAAHRKQMPYTDAVIHEIQRFANIVPGNLPHATTQDVTFRGYFIPKGTHVIPLLTSVLQDKAYFERPEEFYPQHFLDSEGNFVKNEAFMPFSAGRRSCAGETLAKMELFLFFTVLMQKFTFQAPPGAELNLNTAVGFTSIPLLHEICALPRT